MNLAKLFEIQKSLDKKIIENKGLEGEDLLPKKILSLQVELGELANELPELFKFWSDKKNNYEKALEEYCNCLHFILSIGLEIGIDTNSSWNVYKHNDITEQFISLFGTCSDLRDMRLKIAPYIDLIYTFRGLGEMLGFTWEQVEQAYLDKNRTNHRRQDDDY